MRIVRVDEGQWRVIAQMRLRALRDAREAPDSVLEREERFTERHWRMRLRATPTWFALDDDGFAWGMISLIQEPGSPVDDRHIVSLWVAPEARRRGVAWALVDTVRTVAIAGGARTISLWLLDGNTAAGDLFVRAGFSRTGVRQQMPLDRHLVEERYQLAVDGVARH